MYPNFFCEVCNIQLNSENQYATHVQGQKHLKRTSLLPPRNDVIKEELQEPSFADDVDMELEEAFSTFSDQPKIFRCPVCIDFVTSDPLMSKQHSESVEHENNLKREVGIFLQDRVPIESCFKPFAVADETSTEASLHNERKLFKCFDCNITRRSRIQLSAHFNSKMHRRTSFPPSTICSDTIAETQLPPIDIEIPAMPPIEERLQTARNHSFTCGFHYHDSFTKFPLELKIDLLSSHFAFIGKNEPIPDLRMLLVDSVNAE